MKRIIKILFSSLLLFSTLTGCDVRYDNIVLSYFDEDDKNITIAAGTDPLILGLKSSLLMEGWQVLTFLEEDQSSIDFSTIETRYLMLSSYDQGKDLLYGEFVREYEFTIYDTDTGFEVVVLFGSQRTVDEVIEQFNEIIINNYELQ